MNHGQQDIIFFFIFIFRIDIFNDKTHNKHQLPSDINASKNKWTNETVSLYKFLNV